MTRSTYDIAPYFHVLVADSDVTFCRRTKNILEIIGFTKTTIANNTMDINNAVENDVFEIALVDLHGGFDVLWSHISKRGTLLVGTTYDKNSRTWVAAIRRGADAILLKQYQPEMLRPLLTQIVSSQRAWRGRLVQFPNTPAMRALARSGENQSAIHPSSSGELA